MKFYMITLWFLKWDCTIFDNALQNRTRHILTFLLLFRFSIYLASRNGPKPPVPTQGDGGVPAVKLSLPNYPLNTDAFVGNSRTPSGNAMRGWCRTRAAKCVAGAARSRVCTLVWTCAILARVPRAQPLSSSPVHAAKKPPEWSMIFLRFISFHVYGYIF